MSKAFLLEQLENIENAKRVNRERVANIVYKQPELITHLVDLVFEVDNKISIKAAWILEWVCIQKDLNYIIPHLDIFTQNIHKLSFDSAIRPCSKICEAIAKSYLNKEDSAIKNSLKTTHIDKIIEVGFDWLITPQKIAVRAYTMTCLFLFGTLRGYDWIHPELENLVRTKIIYEGKGCKARGRHILVEIEKFNKS